MYAKHRRLRASSAIRSLLRENGISLSDLIYPLFVVEGENVCSEVGSMPGVFHHSLDRLQDELAEIDRLGLQAILLFGVPDSKDGIGSQADNENGIVQRATRIIKEKYPHLYVIADNCLCQYTDHGHCGMIVNQQIENDASLERLVSIAVSQARSGADMIAPSNMMDGFVQAIRSGLDEAGFSYTPIMSYAVKYASSFYGPFREAAHSTPEFGDRKTYQMDPANAREAFREAEADAHEGADMLIVKPGMPYLDIICRLRERFNHPIVAYQVSGEYAMIRAAGQNGWLDEKQVVLESLLSFKRAGADLIITYFAKEVARWSLLEESIQNKEVL